MPIVNLDTHVLIKAMRGDLTSRERELLSGNPWGVSAIVLWELAKLVQLTRVSIDLDSPEVAAILSNIHVWPLDLAVARASTRLDFRGDPADEIIAATSVVHAVPLMTRDRRILRSKVVPLAFSRPHP
jgi:PIN domain nuclease of toxin-antitoxin system